MSDCVFCDIVNGEEPAVIRQIWFGAGYMIIEPIKPVVDGHVLLIPFVHHDHAADDVHAAQSVGTLAQGAALYAIGQGIEQYNIITSAGRAATQTVDHLHVHLIPRQAGDGLRIPWGKEAHEHKPKPRRGTMTTEH